MTDQKPTPAGPMARSMVQTMTGNPSGMSGMAFTGLKNVAAGYGGYTGLRDFGNWLMSPPRSQPIKREYVCAPHEVKTARQLSLTKEDLSAELAAERKRPKPKPGDIAWILDHKDPNDPDRRIRFTPDMFPKTEITAPALKRDDDVPDFLRITG